MVGICGEDGPGRLTRTSSATGVHASNDAGMLPCLSAKTTKPMFTVFHSFGNAVHRDTWPPGAWAAAEV